MSDLYDKLTLSKELQRSLDMVFEKRLSPPYRLDLSERTAKVLRDILADYIATKEKGRPLS